MLSQEPQNVEAASLTSSDQAPLLVSLSPLTYDNPAIYHSTSSIHSRDSVVSSGSKGKGEERSISESLFESKEARGKKHHVS